MTLSRFACSDWFLSLSGYGCYAFGGAKDRHSLPVGLNGSADYAGTEYFLLGEFISTIGYSQFAGRLMVQSQQPRLH